MPFSMTKFGRNFNYQIVDNQTEQDMLNDPTLDLLTFSGRMTNASPQDFIDFFSRVNLHPNTFYINLTAALYSHSLSREVFKAIPEQINTLEINLGRFSPSSPEPFKLPNGITAAQNISRLVINYPADLADDPENFNDFLDDIETLSSLMPNLHEIYFVATDYAERSEAQIKQTEASILANLSFASLKVCQFYRSSIMTDELEANYKPGLNTQDLPLFLSALTGTKLPATAVREILHHTDVINHTVRLDEPHKLLDEQIKKAEEHKPSMTQGLLKAHSLFKNLPPAHHASAETQHEHDMRFGLITI